MTTILILMVWLATAGAAAAPGDINELAGQWTGTVDSPHGQMAIGLTLAVEKGRLVGSLKTAHGDWEVTGVTEKGGLWTVEMQSADGPARMAGRLNAKAFSGEWHGPMAGGTFTLTRPAKP